MRLCYLLAIFTAELVAGHAFVYQVHINGKPQGRGVAIRKGHSNDPVKNVNSNEMTCNKNPQASPQTLSVKAGDRGPVQAYIAPTRSNGRGNVWVKIQSDGFSGGKWGVDRIRKNGGMQSVTFPHVAAGEYLIRPEILALHEGNRVGGAQFYMACIQFKTSGSGSPLPGGIAIPGNYKATDKTGINYDIYSRKGAGYVAPGGPVKRIA